MISAGHCPLIGAASDGAVALVMGDPAYHAPGGDIIGGANMSWIVSMLAPRTVLDFARSEAASQQRFFSKKVAG
jgi:hypothetical protein